MYDYLIVGSGLFGSVFAYEANRQGKKCLVVEKRDHIGGNVYTNEVEGIQVHRYGAHIFHTGSKEIWEYISRFAEFNRYTNSPMAYYKGEMYNLPFNMNTFYKIWGVVTPREAMDKIQEQICRYGVDEPANLEEQAINLVGKDIYEILIKGYTEKQWGRAATELPPDIIKRLPVRLTYDNNYFNDPYQGIPIGGYTRIIEKMLEGTEVRLQTDYLKEKDGLDRLGRKIIYTGPIDEYYGYKFGELEYRSVRFETEILEQENYQGNAVVNYTEYEVPYTRIIEHKHFEFGTQKKTVVSREYPVSWKRGDEPYYPINDKTNNLLYGRYAQEAEKESNIIFGGRLGRYQYYDMHQVVAEALACAKAELSGCNYNKNIVV